MKTILTLQTIKIQVTGQIWYYSLLTLAFMYLTTPVDKKIMLVSIPTVSILF